MAAWLADMYTYSFVCPLVLLLRHLDAAVQYKLALQGHMGHILSNNWS